MPRASAERPSILRSRWLPWVLAGFVLAVSLAAWPSLDAVRGRGLAVEAVRDPGPTNPLSRWFPELVVAAGILVGLLASGVVAFAQREGRVRERLLAEERACTRLEDEQHTLFEVSLDLLAVLGPEGSFRQVNPSWERVFGWGEDELLARAIDDLWLAVVRFPPEAEA